MMHSSSKMGISPRRLETPLTSIAEWENWKHAMVYSLSLDSDFKPYLKDHDFEFGPKTRLMPNRKLVATGGDSPVKAEDKCAVVDMLLNQISLFTPTIPHNDIIRECGTLNEVWQVIRLHNNIETTGALLNDVWKIQRQPNETPQALYSRLKQAYDDSLIRRGTIKYKADMLSEDEEMSPTLHCSIILHWLQILHPKLRDVVTQQFSTQLRDCSYAAIWPEISRSVEALLQGITDGEGGSSSICRFQYNSGYQPRSDFSGRSRSSPSQRARGSFPRSRGAFNRSTPQSSYCLYCKLLEKSGYLSHPTEHCKLLQKERDFHKRDYPSRGAARLVEVDEYGQEYDDYNQYDESYSDYQQQGYPFVKQVVSDQQVTDHQINLVTVNASPTLSVYHNNTPYTITLDSGGTCNALDSETAKELRCDIRQTVHRAWQADGVTELNVIGETSVEFQRQGKQFCLRALVFHSPTPTILGGMPFFIENDISIRPAKSQIIIGDGDIIQYTASNSAKMKARRIECFTVRSHSKSVILPGEELELVVPHHVAKDGSVAVEPRFDNHHAKMSQCAWPDSGVHQVVNGKLKISNTTREPILINKNSHICNILPQSDFVSPASILKVDVEDNKSGQSEVIAPVKKTSLYSASVQVDPDNILKSEEREKFKSLISQYDAVFNPVIGTYNNKSGPVYVEVNMGPEPPPQFKGRVPFYGKQEMQLLQEKFDVLVAKGVFQRPQDLGVTMENVNPSFLVKKRDSLDKRLVTDFTTIASHCRPTPTLMPNVDATLRQIAEWNVLLKTDFTEAYFQLQLKKSSMKYCGVVSPFQGSYVYTRGCMGLPGTEVALEELTCRLFGHMVKEGKVAKLADDLFVGGKNITELHKNFEEVLQILQENNIRLSGKKTIIAPKSVLILGWIWCNGTIRSGAHRLSALSECEPPETVKALRSYIGAYRFLSRVVKNYAALLLPLENMIVGEKVGTKKLEWSDSKLVEFQKAQSALKDAKAITLPRSDDILHIVTDAAITPTAVGAVMYAVREGKPLLAGFFNSKLPLYQRKWLPCEVEGVAIGAAISHFAPYILQSNHKPVIFTDSKPCVDAVKKLNRGEFSVSARLTTFLSSVSRYQAIVKHIQGAANVTSDFISRNPVECKDDRCQLCSFLKASMDAVVATIKVSDVLEGRVSLPFINKGSWVEIQELCSDLRHVFKFIRNGTTPGKKGRNLREVKRYMSSKVVISREGALVVRQIQPFNDAAERIVVPQQVLHGILTVLHLRLCHPTAYQLNKVFNRFFFALNVETAIDQCTTSCHHCSSMNPLPTSLIEESTESSPDHFAQKFAADVIKRNSQLILVLRETVSSFTQAELIISEQSTELSAGLLRLSNLMRPSKLTQMIIRVDPHVSHVSMFMEIEKNRGLAEHNIKLEIGRVLNKNKNPVGEKAVQELTKEILNQSPEGGQISTTTLSNAVAMLNSRLRAPGVSAHEMFTQRDQTTGFQLSLDDINLISEQHSRRQANHKYSDKSKSRGKPSLPAAKLSVGDIVYIYQDKNKLAARPRYIVISIDGEWCKLRRFANKRLHHVTYKAKLTECYLVPVEVSEDFTPSRVEDDDEGVEIQRRNYKLVPEVEDPDSESLNEEEEEEEDEELSESSDSSDQPSDSSESSVQSELSGQQEDEVVVSEDVYPCSICQRSVTDQHMGLCCDNCEKWSHRYCLKMRKQDYQKLMKREEFQWNCPACPQVLQEDQQEQQEDQQVLKFKTRLSSKWFRRKQKEPPDQ